MEWLFIYLMICLLMTKGFASTIDSVIYKGAKIDFRGTIRDLNIFWIIFHIVFFPSIIFAIIFYYVMRMMIPIFSYINRVFSYKPFKK